MLSKANFFILYLHGEKYEMKICSAQTRSVKGYIEKNIENHKKMIEIAVENKAEVIIFPELSLTGYEPQLAKDLATNQDDKRFDEFQKISDLEKINIGVGVPTMSDEGILISQLTEVIYKVWRQLLWIF